MIKFWFDKFNIGRASHRLRAFHPCQSLKSKGIDSSIINNINDVSCNDIVIFSKDSNVNNMRKLKSSGFTVGFDLCDNKFEEDKQLYMDYCDEVDFITVNSSVMQQVVLQETGKKSFYYTDQVDREIQNPKVSCSNPLRLVWYGSSSSNKYVDWVSVIKNLNDNSINYRLSICINSPQKLRNKLIANLKRNNLEKELDKIFHVEWTWDQQQKLVDDSDIVFIPILADNELSSRRTKTKSHNRLVDGLAMGKFVVSSPLESYLPLKDFCWLGDPAKGIEFYIKNQAEVVKKILGGQEWIKKNASADVVSDQLLNIYKIVKKKNAEFN